jgi:RNA polymerase sigma factor (sigma-70 family)
VARGIEDLFRAHWPLVLGYLARRTGSATLAEELAQETFYRATRAFLGWRGGSPAAWLLAIARNVLLDEARRGQRLVDQPKAREASRLPLRPGGARSSEAGTSTSSTFACSKRPLELGTVRRKHGRSSIARASSYSTGSGSTAASGRRDRTGSKGPLRVARPRSLDDAPDDPSSASGRRKELAMPRKTRRSRRASLYPQSPPYFALRYEPGTYFV